MIFSAKLTACVITFASCLAIFSATDAATPTAV
jgi:hypothetical protein